MARFNTDLHLAVSDDELRPIIQMIHIKDGKAYATNGHIIVRQCLKNLHDFDEDERTIAEGRYITAAAWKAARKASKKKEGVLPKVTDAGIVVVENGADVLYEWAVIDGNPINFEAVMPHGQLGAVDQIGINPTLAEVLFKAMRIEWCAGLEFHFRSASKIIECHIPGIVPADNFGGIMPTMLA